LFGGAVVFESAGFKPQSAADAQSAIYTLKRDFDIDAADHVPRDVRCLDFTVFNLIVAFDKETISVKLAERVGFEPTSRVIDAQVVDSTSRYRR
jgi:protein-tyrosine-phosphatase